MNYIKQKVVHVVSGWARGRSWVDRRCLRLGEVHERGSTLEGVLGEVHYWGKCIKGKALWKESDNELCQIEGCRCGENHGTDNETQDNEEEEETITLEVLRHHESLDQTK